ncbi:unnamed protein product [Adineta steineri]|uniref:Uncharacterized protein n=1 Tax=Adineta steineri TaxID=433720 RepID=A0A814S2N3_9BILA|nr:unnamed protein product [Adineta steineri]
MFDIRYSTLDTIYFGISVLLTTYKQVSIIFVWQLHQTLLNVNNDEYSSDTCEVVLHLNHTNQNQVQHLTWHYDMLRNNNEQKKSKYEQISIIPNRDAVQKSFCIYVPQSRFLSELTWIEEDKEKELLPADTVD